MLLTFILSQYFGGLETMESQLTYLSKNVNTVVKLLFKLNLHK